MTVKTSRMLYLIIAIFLLFNLICASVYLSKLPKDVSASLQLILSIILLVSIVSVWLIVKYKGMNAVPELIHTILVFGAEIFCIFSIAFGARQIIKLSGNARSLAIIQLITSIILFAYLSAWLAFTYNIIPMQVQRTMNKSFQRAMTISLE